MKGSDRYIAVFFVGIAVVGLFWFMAISPKRAEVKDLDTQIETLNASIDEQHQVKAFAEQARAEFPKYYGKLVVLGKAVPEQQDSNSLLVELSSVARKAKVEFRTLTLAPGGAGTEALDTTTSVPATPGGTDTTAAAGTDGSTPPDATSADGTTTTAAAPLATEATAASLPIGAAIGPAGLPVLPYDLLFSGRFFQIADFIAGIDGLVGSDVAKVAADGRLMTIDGFALNPSKASGFPNLDATFHVTTYSTPSGQGLTAGASPTGPSLTTSPSLTPASTAVTP